MMITKQDVRKMHGELMALASTKTTDREKWAIEWYLADSIEDVIRNMECFSAFACETTWRKVTEVIRIEGLLCLLGVIPQDFSRETLYPFLHQLESQTFENWRNAAGREDRLA